MKSTQDISAQRRVRCGKDERDRQIDVQSKSYAAVRSGAAFYRSL